MNHNFVSPEKVIAGNLMYDRLEKGVDYKFVVESKTSGIWL